MTMKLKTCLRGAVGIAAAFGALSSACVFAEEGTSSESFSPGTLARNLALSYHGEFTATRPDAALWSLLTVGWKLSSRVHAEVQAQTNLTVSGGGSFSMMNPRVGVSGLVLSSENWYLWANANVEPPLTVDSRSQGLGFSPGTFQAVEFMPSHSRWSVGAEHWIRYYPAANQGGYFYDVQGNISPMVHVRLSSSILAEARVSLNYFHIQNLDWKVPQGNDLSVEPGLSWNPLPILNVRPYLSFRSGTDSSIVPSAFGLWVTGTFL